MGQNIKLTKTNKVFFSDKFVEKFNIFFNFLIFGRKNIKILSLPKYSGEKVCYQMFAKTKTSKDFNVFQILFAGKIVFQAKQFTIF